MIISGDFFLYIDNGMLCVLIRQNPTAADIIIFVIMSGDFFLYIDSGMLCVLIWIASMRRF